MARRLESEAGRLRRSYFYCKRHRGQGAKPLSWYTTNNVAEKVALLMGFEAVDRAQAQANPVHSDLQLLVRQFRGEYRVRYEKLQLRYQSATGLLRQFGSYRIVPGRREFNQVADRLANRGTVDASR